MKPENKTPEIKDAGAHQEKTWKVLEGADDAFDQVVPFPNDDIPLYLQKLRKFQEQSRDMDVIIK